MNNKLYTLLAKTDALATSFKNGLKNYIKFFKGEQGAFLGQIATYTPEPDAIDEPNRRGTVSIITTVGEKLDYLVESSTEYIDALFAQEATNAANVALAELIVDDESWGIFSSLELLRLKSFLENGDFKSVYQMIPVRSDSIPWEKCTHEMYSDREGIYQTPLQEAINQTTEKESYILPDPNINKLGEGKSYTPQVANRSTKVVLGKGTIQNFSGQWSQRQKAEALRRIDRLHVAVIEALKRANDCDIIESKLTAEKIFGYING